ncbi:MAG: hypothetical protein M3076_06820, partial [Actinomycetota bacterium]|nr:hypothetical protein [Actinomycetota bacterium]
SVPVRARELLERVRMVNTAHVYWTADNGAPGRAVRSGSAGDRRDPGGRRDYGPGRHAETLARVDSASIAAAPGTVAAPFSPGVDSAAFVD